MAVLWQYYLGIAVATVVLVGFLITKTPILLIPVVGIWLYYATLRCPSCKMLIKANRKNWWRFPATTCLKCGRDLTKP
jgi:hypothetical protein